MSEGIQHGKFKYNFVLDKIFRSFLQICRRDLCVADAKVRIFY